MLRRTTLTLLMFLIPLILASCQTDPIKTRDDYFASGREFYDNGQYEEAAIQYLNALKADSAHIPSRMALVDAYQKLGNHQAAIAELRKVLEQDPDNIEAKLSLGSYYLVAAGVQGQQWYEEAQRYAEEILAIEPDNLKARILLGNAYAGLKDFDRSIEELQQVLKSDPENLAAFLGIGAFELGRNDPEQAEQVFLDAVNTHPDVPIAHRALGSFYASTKDYSKAEKSFRRAFDLAPGDETTILALVRLYLSQNQPDQAEAIFKEAIDKVPEPLPIQMALASFYIAQGNFEGGLRMLESLNEEHPENRTVTLQLAEVYINLGRPEKAEEVVASLLDANSNDPDAHYLNGRILAIAGNSDDALGEFEKTIQFKPGSSAAYLAKANLLLQRGSFSEAERTIRAVLSFNKNNLAARAGLAKVLALTGEANAALTEAQAVLDQIPNSSEALMARAEANLRLRHLDDARLDFETLSKQQPDNPYLLHRLGSIAGLQGNLDEALRLFRKSLTDNPDLVESVRDIVVVYFRKGNPKGALAELDLLAQRSQHKDMFHGYKGQIYLAQKQYTRAEQEFRKAVEINPDNYGAYIQLGQLKLQQDDPADAIREVDDLIERDPNFAPAYLMKAYYLSALKRNEEAALFYRRTLELVEEKSQGYAVAANNLSWLMAERNENLTEARTFAERAREIDPNNAHYADTLGWVYYKMGNYTLAVDQLLFGVNKGEPKAGNYYRLGMAFLKKGDAIQAKQSLRKALSMGESFDGIAEARKTLSELG